MTGRLAEVEARIGTVTKLGTVIGAMRGIATARVQEARTHGTAIRAYAATLGTAIAETLSLLPEPPPAAPAPPGTARHLVILLTAEQGFAGTYNEQVFDAAQGLLDADPDLFVIGERGALLAAERHRPPLWTGGMIAHPAQAVPLVGRLTEALFARIAAAGAPHVTVVHAAPVDAARFEVAVKRLVPFDYSRFPIPAHPTAPRLTLPPERLLALLVEEYIVAELIEAVMLALAAENLARMRAMIAAHDNVTETMQTLVISSRRLRQEEITEEIVELAAGRTRD